MVRSLGPDAQVEYILEKLETMYGIITRSDMLLKLLQISSREK